MTEIEISPDSSAHSQEQSNLRKGRGEPPIECFIRDREPGRSYLVISYQEGMHAAAAAQIGTTARGCWPVHP